MTHLAILSDLHGNLPALEAGLADMKNYRLDQVIVAGDVINFGPFSRQVVEIYKRASDVWFSEMTRKIQTRRAGYRPACG